jgi:hypothetical protein
MKKLRGCLGVFLIFFLGVVVGAILTHGSIYSKVWGLIESGPDKVAEFTLQRMNDELKLDTVQKREFERIADRTRLRLRAIRYKNQPETDAVIEESSTEVRAILTPKQQKRFDDLMKRFQDRWRAEGPEHPAASSTPVVEEATSAPPAPPVEQPDQP